MMPARKDGDPLRSGAAPFVALIAGTLLTAWGCRRESAQQPRGRDIRLLPGREPHRTVEPRPFVIPNPGQCAPLRTVSIRLTGRLEVVQKFRPPGFGETPDKDARLTVVLLHLATPLDVCAGTFADVSQPPVHALRVIQLSVVDPEMASRQLGVVDAYGWLDSGSGSNDFTKVVLRVDSIPAIRAGPYRSKSTIS
jgi:hypothetical protein